MIALKNLILSKPSKTLPVHVAATYKEKLNLPNAAAKFIADYPSVFSEFTPETKMALPHVRLTSRVIATHKEERLIYDSNIKEAAERLIKLLMLTGTGKLPLHIIDRFRWDLGLPHDYMLSVLPNFVDYFQICNLIDASTKSETLGLEIVSWRDDLAVSFMEKNAVNGVPISFKMQLPNGFDLEKRVKKWVDEWQDLPYISSYEDAFHLPPNSDIAEKWTVSVLHELLYLLVSKKTERENIYSLGDYLGFGSRFRRAIIHHPGIFYVSNKIRTQTVVLREAYRKDFLVEKHPLMSMRFRYIHLMNKAKKRLKPVEVRRNPVSVLLAGRQ